MFAEMRRVDETRDADCVQLLARTDPGQRQHCSEPTTPALKITSLAA